MSTMLSVKGIYKLSDKLIALIIFTLVAIPYYASTVGVMNSMDGPQFALTRALVEKRTYQLDGYSWLHPDYAIVDDHVYSKRSPGISFLAVPFYLYARTLGPWLFPPYFGKNVEGIDDESPVEAVTYGLTSLVGALSVMMLYLISRQYGSGQFASVLAALAFAFGSLMWCYSSSFVREPAVVFFLLCAYLAVLRLKQSHLKWAIIIGFSSGFAVFMDNVAIFPVVVIFCIVAYILRRNAKSILFLLVFFFLGLLPLIIYNLTIFHRPLVIQYLYDQNLLFRQPELHTLSNPIWSIPATLFSVGPIPPQAVPYIDEHSLFAKQNSTYYALETPYQGILVFSPILIPALFYLLLRRRTDWRFLLASTVAISIIAPISRFSAFYNPNSYDTRYFLPATAFLFIPLSVYLDTLIAKRRSFLNILFIFITVIFISISLLNGWEAVLQNYAPHVTGPSRSSLVNIVFGDEAIPRKGLINTKITRANVSELFVQTFPNYANVIYLAPILCLIPLFIWLLTLKPVKQNTE